MSLTVEVLDRLRKQAGYYQTPLRVTPEFHRELESFEPPEPPYGRPVPATPPPPVGTKVVVVYDGTENVRRVDGGWAFIPPQQAVLEAFRKVTGWTDAEVLHYVVCESYCTPICGAEEGTCPDGRRARQER